MYWIMQIKINSVCLEWDYSILFFIDKKLIQKECLLGFLKKFQVYFIHINFFKKPNNKCTIEPKSYSAMLLYLFLDSLLCTCPRKMETEKWPNAADSPLLQ